VEPAERCRQALGAEPGSLLFSSVLKPFMKPISNWMWAWIIATGRAGRPLAARYALAAGSSVAGLG